MPATVEIGSGHPPGGHAYQTYAICSFTIGNIRVDIKKTPAINVSFSIRKATSQFSLAEGTNHRAGATDIDEK
jgi:hypothetical protein